MFLTRLGMGSKMIVTGDVTQIDLPRTTASGLIQALKILRNVKGIGRVEFEKKTSCATTWCNASWRLTNATTRKSEPPHPNNNNENFYSKHIKYQING